MSNYDKALIEVNSVKFDSREYWKMRAELIEKRNDPTYSIEERRNYFHLWNILIKKSLI